MDLKAASISAKAVWVKDDPDGKPCINCGDQMLSSKNVLAIQTSVRGTIRTAKTKTAICNPCLELLEKEDP